MIGTEDYQISDPANFNNYIWGVGHKSYEYQNNQVDIKEIGNENTSTASYGIAGGNVPAYNLGKKSAIIPYSEYGDNSRHQIFYNEDDCPNPTPIGGNNNYRWRMRMEFDMVNVPGFQNMSALRIDYFEETFTNNQGVGILKESWYFVKNVGLVEVQVKHFDRVKQTNPSFPYATERQENDNDFLADRMSNPHVEMIHEKHY